jgi:uncharacterized delta-60 repeat protein
MLLRSNFTPSRRTLFTAIAVATILLSAASAWAKTTAPTDVAQTDGTLFGNPYGAGGYANSLLNLNRGVSKTPLNRPAAGEVDPAFNPTLDSAPGFARASAVQSDGKILVGGNFRTVNGARYTNLVRLNPDYSVDATFSATTNGSVMAIAVQPDGRIILGGFFTAVNGHGQNYLARLLPNGTTDTSFNTLGGASDAVYDVAIQPDGKVLVAGSFVAIAGAIRPYVTRLNADGSRDTGFVTTLPLPGSPTSTPTIVYSLSLQSDGKVVIGGLIVKTPFPNLTTTPIMRLNADGSTDDSFNPGTISSNAYKVAVQPDGKIMMCGFFSTINGTSRNRIARLNSNGSLDTSFNPGTGANVVVYNFNVRSDGKVVVVGRFTTFNGIGRINIALLSASGTLDESLNAASTAGTIFNLSVSAEGKILALGAFQTISDPLRDSMVLFNVAGSVDGSVNLNTTATGGMRSLAVQLDGKILVAGVFGRVNGVSRTRLARLNPDGTLDPTFNAGNLSGNLITTIYLQPDGKILAGGGSIVRLNSDGSLDPSFSQSPSVVASAIRAITMQPDGKILISYTTAVAGQPNGGDISRLNADGSLDSSFDGLALAFEAIAVLPNGKILAGGPVGIAYVNSGTGQNEAHYGIVRLNADGSHDRTFRSGFLWYDTAAGFSAVYSIEARPNGQILVGGTLYTAASPNVPVVVARLDSEGTIDGSFQLLPATSPYEYPRVKKLKTLPSGKILVAGLFDHVGAASSNNLARLNADGGADVSFEASTDGPVSDFAIDGAGRVLFGGDFETALGVPRTGLARLLSESVSRAPSFDFDGDGKSDISVFRPSDGNWYLLGSTAGFSTVNFGIATDKLAPADYDGDGKTDVAVFRDGLWYIIGSQVGFLSYNFGAAGDIPQPADFTGDGKVELAVFRPSTGVWYKLDVNGNAFSAVSFGQSGDLPVVGDYDGDGKADPAVFRAGIWYLLGSTQGFSAVNFGITNDKPVPADYDGDGKTDPAVYRDGTWYLLRSTAGFTGVQFGQAGDLPAAADYDGDGKADVAVFRAGQWYLLPSGGGFSAVAFGSAGDKPVPNAFVP